MNLGRKADGKAAFFISIRAKMLLFFGFGAALILVSVSLINLFGIPFAGTKGNYQAHRSEIIKRIDGVADLKMGEIRQWFEERINHAKALSEEHRLNAVIARFRNGMAQGEGRKALFAGIRGLEEYREASKHIHSMMSVYDEYENIRIADIKTGIVIFSTDEESAGIDISEDKAIKNARLAGVNEQVYFKKYKGRAVLHILQPIVSSSQPGIEGRPSLAALFIINPEKLLKKILHAETGLGQSGEVILVDMNRTILSPLKYPLPGNKKAEPLEYRFDSKPAELAVLGIDGIVFGVDYTGAPVIAAVRHIRLTSEFGLGMIAKINEEEIFAFARQSLKQSLLASGLGFLLVLLLVYVFSGWITYPVIQLRRAAEKVMEGDLSARASVKTGDEVGFLAASFNLMVEEIQKWNEELETKVRQRTAELNLELTERKHAEDALRVSEERFRAIASNTPDHILMQDSELRYTFVVNPQLSLTEQDMIGKTDYDFLSKEEADKLTKVKRHVMETGEPLHLETSLISKDGKPEFFDGTYVPKFDAQGQVDGLIGYFRNVTERKRAEERISRLTRLYSVLSKINEVIVRTKEPEELYKQACKIIIEDGGFRMAWIGIVDPVMLSVNPVAIYGHEDGYLKMKHMSADENIPEGRGQTGIAVRTGGYVICNNIENDPIMAPWRDEALKREYLSSASFALKSGTQVIGALNIYSSVAYFFQEEVLLLKALAEDVSYAVESMEIEKQRMKTEYELQKLTIELENRINERTVELQESQQALMNLVEDLNVKSFEIEKANLRLRELDQLKSMFIASMSHELRTPLNSIIGFTGIILQGMSGEISAEQRKQLKMVQGSARHLLELINDIIDLSKIEAGKVELVIKEFDLSAIVKEVKNSFNIAVAEKDLKMSMDIPESLIVRSDERRTKQLIMNLLSNAVKFTDKGSVRVTMLGVKSSEFPPTPSLPLGGGRVREGVSDAFIQISVEDTGRGIREEDMDKLFKPFSRISVEGTPKQEGTGLGLYLSKKIANLLGGEIKAESEFQKGSKFIFTMPMRYERRWTKNERLSFTEGYNCDILSL